MANEVETFLSSVSTRLKNFFTKLAPIAKQITEGAVALEPIVDTALVATGNAAAASLYNAVSGEVLNAETAAAAAAQQTGTGAQKTAAVLSTPAVQKAFLDFEQAVGVQPHTSQQQVTYINAVVATLNGLNATPTAQPAA